MVLLIILVPWIGVLIYLIARGGSMNERAIKDAQDADARMRAYVQEAAGTGGSNVSSELRELAGLRDAGRSRPRSTSRRRPRS